MDIFDFKSDESMILDNVMDIGDAEPAEKAGWCWWWCLRYWQKDIREDQEQETVGRWEGGAR